MKLTQILESKQQLLIETKTYQLWESAGLAIKEAALTKDQIQQLFQQVEQGATAGGANRTALGKGKDAASAVNKAWEDLKTKIQDSGPIKAVDQKYDEVVSKIEAGLGGPDNKVNQVIQRYREFAKKHPVAQGFIYAALIAAAGISGAGLGGAAVLGLLKMSDKLLQGEKFSSAAYAGAKTGILAFAASKVGDYIKDKFATYNTETSYYVNGREVDKATYEATMKGIQKDLAEKGIDFEKGSFDKTAVDAVVKDQLSDIPVGGGIKDPNFDALDKASLAKSMEMNPMLGLRSGVGRVVKQENTTNFGKKLSEGQVYMLFNRVDIAQDYLAEAGLLSKVGGAIKGAASKVGQKIATTGKNLTTKVTADKLNSAWQKAGSPTDSDELFNFLTQQGVNKEVIAPVYDTMKLPVPKGAAEPESGTEQPKKRFGLNWDEETGEPLSPEAKAKYEKMTPQQKADQWPTGPDANPTAQPAADQKQSVSTTTDQPTTTQQPAAGQQIDIVALAQEIKSVDPDITTDVKKMLDADLAGNKKAAAKPQPNQTAEPQPAAA